MTRQEAELEMEQLRRVFPRVRLLTEAQVQAGETAGIAARQALEQKTSRSRMEYRGQELYEVTALYVRVEDTPCVLELERKLDKTMLLDPEDSELLFNNIAEYRGKLYRDPVTGAYNERYYQEKYRNRILTAGIAVLRIDDFKTANDVYGHYAGDSVLETVADVLRRNLGERDRLIRRGADRLLLILPEVEQSGFGPKLEHLRLQLAAASVPGYSHLRISASIGGVWLQDGEVEAAVEHAERLAGYARMQKNTVITEQQPEHAAAAPVRRRQSVLIVDDSELNRKMLAQMLGRPFDIAEAATGEDALQLLEQNATGISVVLLDIHLPGIDGFAVLEEMNRRDLLEQIPVIMISSEDTVDAVRRAFDLGASDYISRPFDAKVVYQRIINTIRLYAKQRRLSAMAADLAFEKERTSRMMIGILSQVVGLADVYERLVSRPVDGQVRTHREAVRMICTGVCGAFNPMLLECLQDMEAEIAAAMQGEPKDT